MKHFSSWLVLSCMLASCSADTDVLDRLPEKIPVKLAAPSDLRVGEGTVKSNSLVISWITPPHSDRTGA